MFVPWEIFWLIVGLIFLLVSAFNYFFTRYTSDRLIFWIWLLLGVIVLFGLFVERESRLDKEHATGAVETEYNIEVLDISPRGEWVEFSPVGSDAECEASMLYHSGKYIVVKETAECTEPTSWK